MRVTRLSLRDLRRFDSVELLPAPGLNLLTGDNGAGKTSVLEALHLMAYGRSFRGRVRDGLVREHAQALEVFVEWLEDKGGEAPPQTRRAGLRHSGGDWSGRLDGREVAHLGQLCTALAVVTFEPGSHALVSCKRWKAAKPGVEHLRELVAAVQAHGEAREAMYVTLGELSSNAQQFAKENNIRVLQGPALAQLLKGIVATRKPVR